MLTELFSPDIQLALREGKAGEVAEFLAERHPAEVVEMLSGLAPDEVLSLLNALEPQFAADVFCEFPRQFQADTAALLDKKALVALVKRLDPDDRVDLLKSIPEERVGEVLPALAQAERDDIKRLAAYPEGTVGSIMTTRYMTLPLGCTASEAITRIRNESPGKESIYYSYIIDRDRMLQGVVSLREIIMAPPDALLKDIMNAQVVAVNAGDDREEATFQISRLGLLAIPVVDANGMLVGIVTHDDAIEVIEQERTEDMERFMAITGSHDDTGYIRTSIWAHFAHRIPWLVILAFFGLVSGSIIQGFESTLTSLLILAFYMPMLADTGGNTGSQSATVVVRALALKEIGPKDAFKVLWKELRVGLLLAAALGILALMRVVLFTSADQLAAGFSLLDVGFAIALALALQVVSATVIGAALPLAAARLGADPALIASPALTTVVDITGLVIYFNTARLILGV
jgi:magnesium transporter